MLDEQSFQDMLSAAFTIQEHNAQRKRSLRPTESRCAQCFTPVSDEAHLCQTCLKRQEAKERAPDQQPSIPGRAAPVHIETPRPGETLQRKWASLWLMSQEQGLRTDSFSTIPRESESETVTAGLPKVDFRAADHLPEIESFEEGHHFRETIEIPLGPDEAPTAVQLRDDPAWLVSSPILPEAEGSLDLLEEIEFERLETTERTEPRGSLRDLRLKLRFHRADFYLVVAIAVATFAMIWVLLATPAPGTHRKPRLRPWERALVSLGLAEAPEPAPRRGNPNISVWIDPKTALYYCAGEELYGKAPGGHFATQREAQMDQFEPAGRVACE